MSYYELILKKYYKREILYFQILDNNNIILGCSYYSYKYTVGDVKMFLYYRKTQGYKLKEHNSLSYLYIMDGYEQEIANPIEIKSYVAGKLTQLTVYQISKGKYVCINTKYLKKVFINGLKLFSSFSNPSKYKDISSVGFVYLVDENNKIKGIICPVRVNNISEQIEKVAKND